MSAAAKTFDYPLSPGSPSPWALGPAKRLLVEAKFRLRRAKAPRPPGITLAPIGPRGERPLSDDDVPLVFLARNDRRYLNSFLRHYRAMGVTRFLCVDDRSDDGTRERLLAEPDVDVFQSNVRYKDAGRGKAWREMLFNRYGHGRWYLNVDSDEYLVYETLGSESLRDYTRRLEGAGVRRVPAVMLDLYPSGPLAAAQFDGEGEAPPWEVATHFDGRGYTGVQQRKGIDIRGGVRQRLYGLDPMLIKYPLVRWYESCSMGRSIHQPWPERDAFAGVMACLLHPKIFSDLAEQIERVVAEGQHFDGSKLYRHWGERLREPGGAELTCEHSIPYRGPEDLAAKGFLLPLAA